MAEPGRHSRRQRPGAYVFFFVLFALLLVAIHLPYLTLPFYWDELGQFVPAALDLYQAGKWVPSSTVPNVHPPGVMAWLALVWKIAGFSIPATRIAMLLVASVGLLLVFLVAIQLCRPIRGAPALTAVLLMLLCPLFYTQAMLAQLDMPAMLFTLWALLWFLQGKYRGAALVSVALVLVKETGIVVPLVLGLWLVAERKPRTALWYLLPVIPLAGWLLVLSRSTGHLLGNSEFTEYNVFYPLHPVRLAMALFRRAFNVFIENFHWIGWLAVWAAWKTGIFRDRAWRIAGSLFAAHVLVVTLLGGATLERYLLPVLPLMYIAMAAAWATLSSKWSGLGPALLSAGLLLSLFWAPPYPYPFENNLAMVDFVRLQQSAATFLEQNYSGQRIYTVWPLTGALRRPEFGYVHERQNVKPVPQFRTAEVARLKKEEVDVFVLYSRDWALSWDPRQMRVVRALMRRFYGYEPPVDSSFLEKRFGLVQVAEWNRGGQWVEVFVKRP